MNFPSDLKYSNEHEWIRLEGDVAFVGISDFAQGELGDIVYVDITSAVGDTVGKNSIFGSIEAVKTTSDLFLPVTGEILEINTELNNSPEVVNSDPYGDGWIVKIKVSDASELDTLMSSESYKEMVGA